MHRKNIHVFSFLVITSLLSACGGGQQGASRTPPPEVTKVEVFEADDWRAEVAHLTEPGTALIRFTGDSSEIAGIPLVYRFESSDYGKRWVTQVRGRDRSVLYGARNSSGEAPWRLHAPSARDGRYAKQLESVPEGLGAAIATQYAKLVDEGVIDPLQRYDRKYEIDGEEKDVAESLAATQKACGHEALSARVDWEGVSDETLLTHSIGARCDSALSALRTACEREGGAAWVRENVQSVSCHLTGEEEPALSLDAGALAFSFALGSVNLDEKARTALLALPDATYGDLNGHIVAASAQVCADEAGEHFILFSPRAEDGEKLAYGSREGLVKLPSYWGLGDGWFQDGRFYNERNNSSFRGYDLRFFSRVEVEGERCRLYCGDREVALRVVDEAQKAELLAVPRSVSPFDRVPHALARDKSGVYYYVDRGNTEATARDFKLYRGRRGAMTLLDMRDVVSDSEGEVFESRTGTLRLIVDRDEAAWIRGKAKDELKPLPIGENLGLIFNELGVYLGRELGTPCDDL